jgi:hypothetical protein
VPTRSGSTTAPAIIFEVVAAGFVATALLMFGPAAGAASEGSVGPPGVPGGFASVMVTKALPIAGGTVTGSVNGHQVTVTVPAGALSQQIDLTLTWGAPSAIGNAGISGDGTVVAIGVNVAELSNGNKFAGTFGRPFAVTISGPFGSKASVVSYNVSAKRWEALPRAAVTSSVASFTISSDPDIAVVEPKSDALTPKVVTAAAPVTTIPAPAPAPAPTPTTDPLQAAVHAETGAGTTDVSTGKPFLLEEIIAGVLVVMGMASLLALTRRRRSTRARA